LNSLQQPEAPEALCSTTY